MCGIAGLLNAERERGVEDGVLERMIHTLEHRGPDGYGYYRDGAFGMAHARLSIIDIDGGKQPLSNEDDSVWVTFNGEIFNYIELRADLVGAGHRFKTQSDTEVIVHAYEEYGDEFVSRLNGQFAIALWDQRQRRLLLARDRVGVRPLFFRCNHAGVCFASEVKAILAANRSVAEFDLQGLAQVFTFWATVGSRTVFRAIQSLPPGNIAVFSNGEMQLRRYWTWRGLPASHCRSLSLRDAAAELRDLLKDAVRLQLRADVPVGAYLSGGLDSSGLVALIREHSDVRLRTFSIAFDDAEFDESEYQKILVQHFGTDHSTIRCSPEDIGACFQKLIWHTETPIVRTGPAPLMVLSGLVRRSGYKVVLTGEGADEVFAGYDIFKEALIRRFWARNPQSTWRHTLFKRLYPYLSNSPVANAAYAREYFGRNLTATHSASYAHLARWMTMRRLWNLLSPDAVAQLKGWDAEAELSALLPPDFDSWNDLARDQAVEANTLLFGYLLSSQGDRAAMANSVEGRVPYLDHRVIEFAHGLPARMKLRGLNEKAVLREALRPLLPERVATRVKQPYRSPDTSCFFVAGEPRDFVADLLGSSRVKQSGLFNPLALNQLMQKAKAGQVASFADNMAFVGMLSTLLVDKHFVAPRAA